MNKKTKVSYALKKSSIMEAISRCGNVSFLSNEITCLKAIGQSHPFIVGLHFAYHDYLECYLILDLIPGGDLRYQLDRKSVMSEPQLSLIALCLGSALKHIHSRHVIHRDIKPENIVLDRYGIPHLTDFGISHCGTAPKPGEHLLCNLPSGTKPYMAPEMLTRSRLHGTAADYWSLGVVLFELFYGVRPFKSLPVNYVHYARRCRYYEMRAAATDSYTPDNDHDHEEGLIQAIMNENQTIVASPLLVDFISQALDPRIPSRLGGQESTHRFLDHPWLTSHSVYWVDKISALHTRQQNLERAASTGRSSSKCLPSTEDRDMVMTSDWFSERYLSCRKMKPYQMLPMNRDGTLRQAPPIEDVRQTSLFTSEVEAMLALYEYEAAPVATAIAERNAITEEILQLRVGHGRNIVKTVTQVTSRDTGFNNSVVGSRSQQSDDLLSLQCGR
jgi:serine/threonine protein kinase